MEEQNNSFIDGWIISFLKVAKELPQKKRKELVKRLGKYLTDVKQAQKELDTASLKGKYNPEVELAKGAKLQASSYDKTQQVGIASDKVTVGGKPGILEFTGIATGREDTSINGTIGIWLSIFRYMRPDGTINHVAGWNIMLPLKAKQTAAATAKAFAKTINAGSRPYKATATGTKLRIVYTEK